jgi:leucyl/phenylalanyl-tRNA--protein transferase
VEALAAGYPLGVFPWPGDDPDAFPWVLPRMRGVLPLENFHLGKSTRRALQRSPFRVTLDQAFEQIITACHEFHLPESWIHPRMQRAYLSAYRLGFAHSVEVWEEDQLVGGLYGIDSGLFFSGESMFHRKPNAGKLAIRTLVEKLRRRGDTILDIQQLTPHMRVLGAEAWRRSRFLDHLQNERMQRTPHFF